VFFSGGFGSGKTSGASAKLPQLMADNPRAPGLVLAPNWRTMWAVTYRRIMTTLRRIMPKHALPTLRDRHGDCFLDFGNGVPVFLRSAKNVDGYDGLDVGWMIIDEARHMSRMAWNVAQGRMRARCDRPQAIVVSTPEMGWLSDEFDSGRPDRELIVAPTRENAHNLAPGYIENLKESYSPRLWRALVEGIFTILEGAVFEAFDPRGSSPWFVDFEATPQSVYFASRRVYLCVDPGYRRSAWLWVVEDDDLNWVVFDELMLDGTSDTIAVRKVNERGWPIDEIWCDPAAGNTQSFEGASTLTVLREVKTRTRNAVRTITAANREIAWGVDKLRVLLGDPDNDQPIRIRFARKLLDYERRKERGIVKDLGAIKYPETKDGRPVVDVPLKDGVTDHSTDALRYWSISRWLMVPKLRRLDARLAATGQAGWKVA